MKFLLSFTITLILTYNAFAQQTIYVDASKPASGNGQSWATAYNNLSDALNNAAEGAEIWVAEGVYVPEGPARLCQFTIDKNVSLYGGFRGDEEFIWERGDYRDYPTILSGDIEGNDEPGDFNNNKDDNCRHVIFIAANVNNSTVIDGFFIQGGYTDITEINVGLNITDNRIGGGILVLGSPIIKNNSIIYNYAELGGGIIVRNQNSGGTIIENCFFNTNRAVFGGAVSIENTHNVGLKNCLFVNNEAFAINNVGGMGGAVEIFNSIQIEINSSVFSQNKGRFGGGLNCERSIVEVKNSLFNNNFALVGGGAVFNLGNTNISSVNLVNNTFIENLSGDDSTCVAALSQEGAIVSTFLKNNIFNNPNSQDIGTRGGVPQFSSEGGNLSINNPSQLNHPSDKTNISVPIFLNLDTRDYSLRQGSPAIGAGVGGIDVPDVDIRGQFRPDPPSSGCYDVLPGCIHVPANCLCFDYTVINGQLSASMPCGDNVYWYLNDQEIGSAGSQFNFDLSSGFDNEISFCIKQQIDDEDYRCCVTIYREANSNCNLVDIPNANISFSITDIWPFFYTYSGELSENYCSFSWSGLAVNYSPGSPGGISSCDYTINNDSLLWGGCIGCSQVGTFTQNIYNCFTISSNLGYSRYCFDNYTLGSQFPKVNPTFNRSDLKLTLEMDENFPSFTQGSAVFLDPGDGSGLIELNNFISEGSYEYEFESSGTYLVKLYVNHPTQGNFTISWSIVPIPASCDGGQISLIQNDLSEEACYTNNLVIRNIQSASCTDCGSGNPSLSYRWQRSIGNPDNFVDIDPQATGPTYTIPSLSQVTFYRRIATFSWNESGQTQNCNDSSNVVRVNPRPNISASNMGPYCEGVTIQLNASSGASHSWMGPSGFSSTDRNPTRQNATTNMGGTYTVTVTDSNGCSSTATTNVEVNPNPSVSASNEGPYCEGVTIQLNASSGASHSWMGPSGFSSTDRNPTRQNATTNMGGTYTVSVTDSNGCSSTATTVVEVKERPSAPMLSEDCTQGLNNGKIIINSPLGEDFRYSLNGGDFQDSPEFSGLSNDSYTVIVESRNTGCRSSSEITVNCCNNPPTLSLNGSSINVCGLKEVEVEDNIFGGSATQVTISHNGNGALAPTNSNTSPFAFKYNPGQDDLGKTVVITVVTDNPVDSSCVEVESRFEIIFYKSDREVSPPDKPCPNRFYPPFWDLDLDLDDILFTSENILILDEGFILLENEEAQILIEFQETFLDGALTCDFSRTVTIVPASTPDLGGSKPSIWTSIFVQNETDTLVLYEIEGLSAERLDLQWGVLIYEEGEFKDSFIEKNGLFFINDSLLPGIVFCEIHNTDDDSDCPVRIYAEELSPLRLADLRTASSHGTEQDAEHILLYPNPGHHQLNILITPPLNGGLNLMVWDSQGKNIYREIIDNTSSGGIDFLHTVNTSAWSPGLYHVQISGQSSNDKASVFVEKWVKL